MKQRSINNLSRRERQIMDIVYRRGEATVAAVRESMPDPPSYSTVRALLKVLEEKGYTRHREQGPRYVYSPTIAREKAKQSALKHLMHTFFDNSAESVVASLIDISSSKLSEQELDRLSKLINRARKKDE